MVNGRTSYLAGAVLALAAEANSNVIAVVVKNVVKERFIDFPSLLNSVVRLFVLLLFISTSLITLFKFYIFTCASWDSCLLHLFAVER